MGLPIVFVTTVGVRFVVLLAEVGLIGCQGSRPGCGHTAGCPQQGRGGRGCKVGPQLALDCLKSKTGLVKLVGLVFFQLSCNT